MSASFEKLGSRILSATVGIAAILAILIYTGERGVRLLTVGIGVLAFLEYFSLVFAPALHRLDRAFCVALGTLVLVSRIYESVDISVTTAAFLLLFIYFLFRAKDYEGNLHQCLLSLSLALLGIIYLSFLLPYFYRLYLFEEGLYWVLAALLIPWAYDTGAYFVGKRWGKHKLYLIVSPGKTIEGVVGGVILAGLTLFLFRIFVFSSLSATDLILLTLGGSLFAQLGDLFESLLKRGLGVKDSGHMIPGHGGLLDRLDALLFVFPFVFVYASWISR